MIYWFLLLSMAAQAQEVIYFPLQSTSPTIGSKMGVHRSRLLSQQSSISIESKPLFQQSLQKSHNCYRIEEIRERSEQETTLKITYPYCYALQKERTRILPVSGKSYFIQRNRKTGLSIQGMNSLAISQKEQEWIKRELDALESSEKIIEILRGKSIAIGDDIDELLDPIIERLQLLKEGESDQLLDCKIFLREKRVIDGEEAAIIDVALQLQNQQPKALLLFPLKGELAVGIQSGRVLNIWLGGRLQVKGLQGESRGKPINVKGAGEFKASVFLRTLD